MDLATAQLHEHATYTDGDAAQRCIQVLRQAKDTPDANGVESTLEVYFQTYRTGPIVARFDYLASRFTQDRMSPRLSEYVTDKGTWALQWDARGCTPAIDRGTVPSMTFFRKADHALVTHAYGEMREIGAGFRLLPEARTTALELRFYPFGRLNSDGLHDQYWANGRGFPGVNLRELTEVGSSGTLSIVTEGYKPNALCALLTVGITMSEHRPQSTASLMIYSYGSFGHRVTSVNSWPQPPKKIQIMIKTPMQETLHRPQPRKKMRTLIGTWAKRMKDQLQRLSC